MKSTFTNALALLAVLTASALTSSADAQVNQPTLQQGTQQTAIQQGQAVPRVVPGYVAPAPAQNRYYFGMNVELIRGYYGTTLRVVSVTPGSPAHNAGLEYGDEIRTVNGRGFEYARDSFEAVSMLNQFVDSWGGVAPAAPAAAGGAVAAYVAPPLPSPQPIANMIVRNVRNGQNVSLRVFPAVTQWGGAAPAQAAPAATATSFRQR